MAAWEQYEVWIQNGSKWEMLASFRSLDLASALARSRSNKMRLIHAAYDNEKLVSEEVLAELGMTRQTSG